MSEPREKAQELNMNRNAPNIGQQQTRATNRRRKEAIEIETGAQGEGGRLPGMTKEYTGWDVYNNEAKKVDTELVNDWRDSLNSLLLFAAIFAAVLTAFIIESKQMLELDPTTVMMDVMIFYTNSVANGTHKIYVPPDFQPDSWAVTVNCLFFASLGASLVAALASVVSLQWVADYDAAITRGGSSPEDRAKRRQFRYAGVVWWKMGDLIAALPLLLYCSVVLFFGGLALWMWEVNHLVGSVVLGGAGLALLFYGVSTLLAVVFVSAPFRTPLGRWIYSSVRLSFSFVYHAAGALRIPLIPAWLEKRNLSSAITRRREDREVESRPEMGMTALVWLANELSVSQDSYDRLLLLAGELSKLKREISSFPGFSEAPWFLIFDLLGWKNLRNNQDEPIVSQDRNDFSVLAQCYRIPEINGIVSPTGPVQYVADASDDDYWSQYCDVTGDLWSPKSPSNRPNSLFLLLRDIPLPSTYTSNEIELTIRLSRWRNSPQMLLKSSDEFDPRIEPSLIDTASEIDTTTASDTSAIGATSATQPTASTESMVNLGMYPRANDLPVWFSRDDKALYTIVVRRMISILGAEGTIPPAFLDALRWYLEVLVVGVNEMGESTCLSMPVRYRNSLYISSETVGSLHDAFTLLLARNLSVFAGDETVFRVKEILTMMWVSPVNRRSSGATVDRVGMENFFDANKSIVMGWIRSGQDITYIHEILRHLRVAQAKEPRIGSLWRVTPPQEDNNLFQALFTFDDLIQGVTPEQHYEIIDMVCQDLALGPQEALEAYFTSKPTESFNSLEDTCLRLLIRSYAGSGAGSFHLTSRDLDGPFKDSWARIATYLMTRPNGTGSSFTLGLQRSLWRLIPNQGGFCSRALREPEIFTRLERIFEYPIACLQHHSIEGHLLLHIFEGFYSIKLSADMTAFNRIPITGREIHVLLSMMIIPDDQYGLLSENLPRDIHEQCLARSLEIGRELRASQYCISAVLSDLTKHLIAHDATRAYICSEELAGMSIGVTKALDLPSDPRVALIIPDLVSGIQKIKEKMHFHAFRPRWENLTADEEATIASNRLMTHLACMKIFGGRNVRMLFCSRARDSYSPAIGWLAIHTE